MTLRDWILVSLCQSHASVSLWHRAEPNGRPAGIWPTHSYTLAPGTYEYIEKRSRGDLLFPFLFLQFSSWKQQSSQGLQRFQGQSRGMAKKKLLGFIFITRGLNTLSARTPCIVLPAGTLAFQTLKRFFSSDMYVSYKNCENVFVLRWIVCYLKSLFDVRVSHSM